MTRLLKLVAPGTPLREGLENVLRAKTGALIVVGYGPDVAAVVDGGFTIDCDFTPNHLYELAKMDGAIILSDDLQRILYANAQLIPDSSIPSNETGIRHRTAERAAKQTGKLVISISQRRGVITLYQGGLRYSLKDIGVILTKANQALQTLEHYTAVLRQDFTNLSASEFEEVVTLAEVASVIQRIERVLRVKAEIRRYIHELGTEGRLVRMQLEELVSGIDTEYRLLLRDYVKQEGDDKISELTEALGMLTIDELLDASVVVRLLGYPQLAGNAEEPVRPRGFRLLSKIPRLPVVIMNNLIRKFGSLPQIAAASIEELDEVDGIGEARARTIRDGLRRLREQVFIDRQI